MMMLANEQLTAEDVRRIILEASTTDFPGKTIDEIEGIMRDMIGFEVDEAVQAQSTPEIIRGDVHLAFLVASEEHPEADEYEDDDPKNDMGFCRTGIRVSQL
jgi:hypothetical protein